MRSRIRFVVSYDGTDFCGWQRQNHGPLKSVQQTIEEALNRVFKEKITLFASGRTDAGVHALNQVCHFDVNKTEASLKRWNIPEALRPHLPKSIVLKKVFLAPQDFHATLSSTHKTYRYLIDNSGHRSAFLHRYSEQIRRPLDLHYLQESSKHLIGKKDFKSFQSIGSQVPHTLRSIFHAEWTLRRPGLLQFSITGSGFLKQMVRNIVGTQLWLEKKGSSPEKIKEIIDLKDRRQAGPPASPQGLFLWRVYYPKELDNRCREL